MKQPLVVCCGVGQDSIALLVGLWKRGIRPDLILFADTGSERAATYSYISILNAWLASVGFPLLTVVVNQVKNFKHWPVYRSLEENLLTNSTLPSIAYGFHSCSSKWKIAPQNRFIDAWTLAQEAWAAGVKVRKAIGFDASPHEQRRAKGCSTYAVQDDELDKYELWFPLQEWGWDRAECIRQIESVGLPVPTKSSCYFCTAMKPWEVDELARTEPDKLKRIVVIEARAADRNLEYAERRFNTLKSEVLSRRETDLAKAVKRTKQLRAMSSNTDRPVSDWIWNGKPLTEGLWRKAVKGLRGGTAKPGSVTEYIRQKGLLSAEEIDRIIAATPTGEIHAGDIDDWQTWLEAICNLPDESQALAA